MRPEGPRDTIAGPDEGPPPPFPLKLSGKVIKGFGRGSKELGIPTANIPIEGLTIGGEDSLDSGIYYGWAGLEFSSPLTSSPTSDVSTPARRRSISEKVRDAGSKLADSVGSLMSRSEDGSLSEREELKEGNKRGQIYHMVMSVGWNPFYKNTVRSIEVHIMHKFPQDFYGRHLNLAILGFIRPEYDYVSKDSLIDDINFDIEVARRSLERPAYAAIKKDKFLLTFPDGERTDKEGIANL